MPSFDIVSEIDMHEVTNAVAVSYKHLTLQPLCYLDEPGGDEDVNQPHIR